jgi:hypothetical protein
MHPCCNEPSGIIQHWDFLTDRATELNSKILIIIPVPNTHCQLSKNPGPNCATFEVFVFLSQLFPYTRQFSTSPNSIIVLSPDICQCTVSSQSQNLLQLYHRVATDDGTAWPQRGRQHLRSDDCTRCVLLSSAV